MQHKREKGACQVGAKILAKSLMSQFEYVILWRQDTEGI